MTLKINKSIQSSKLQKIFSFIVTSLKTQSSCFSHFTFILHLRLLLFQTVSLSAEDHGFICAVRIKQKQRSCENTHLVLCRHRPVRLCLEWEREHQKWSLGRWIRHSDLLNPVFIHIIRTAAGEQMVPGSAFRRRRASRCSDSLDMFCWETLDIVHVPPP